MYVFDTLVEGINQLKADGYTLDFNPKAKTIYCSEVDLELKPEEFTIDHTFRFEGDSNPDDSSILFAISSKKGSEKGILINGYGVSEDTEVFDLIKNL